jgi:hypothetical protein
MHKVKPEPTKQERIAQGIRAHFEHQKAACQGQTIHQKIMAAVSRKAVKGSRISLVEMHNDPDPIPPGTMGTVKYIDDIQVQVDWDNGRCLNLALPQDKYLVVG